MNAPRAARVLSEVLSPPYLIAAAATTAALVSTTGMRAVAAVGTAMLFGAVIPLTYIARQVRSGRLTDRHITRVRAQRHRPLAVALVSLSVGMALLWLIDATAPAQVFTATVVVLVPCMIITVWWQISIHCAVAAVITTYAAVHWDSWWAAGFVAVAALAWARVTVNAHTVAQVVAGSAIGVILAAVTAVW